jgi:hypothetical protein
VEERQDDRLAGTGDDRDVRLSKFNAPVDIKAPM